MARKIKNAPKKYFSIILLLTSVVSYSYSQKSASISQPILSFSNDTLKIKYDIINCPDEALYEIWFEASDQNGERIEARSIHGDVGKGIPCGQNKVIRWNFAPNSILINDGLFITVKGTPLQNNIQKDQISKSKYIISSIAFPGSGLSFVNNGKPYWLMGVAAYAGLATAFYFNSKANFISNNPEPYSDLNRQNELNDSYQQYKNYARVAAISTGVLWTVNLIWTFATIHKLEKPVLAYKKRTLHINLIYTPEITTPVIAYKQIF